MARAGRAAGAAMAEEGRAGQLSAAAPARRHNGGTTRKRVTGILWVKLRSI